MRDPIVIIGAGMAAYSLAREFRKLDQATPLMLVAGDAAHAYAKPALSNALALGKEPHALVQAGPEQMADTLDITVLANTWVTAIDREAREIDTSQGRFAYSQLVLALGADPIRLPLGGDGAADVMSVNGLHDYTLLRERLAVAGPAAHVAIIGAGLIGCEFADDLAGAGYRVTLVDPGALPLSALAAPVLGEALAQAWSVRPVTLRLGTTVDSVARDGDAYALTLADGTMVLADLVVSAVGLKPSVSLAVQAGLDVARGIRINAFGRTSADGIYALGDCAEYSVGDGSAVMPFVAPMLVAARAIAATLAGKPTPIVLKQEAVIVKTPSCKLALLPPPRGVAGSWLAQADGDRIIARFRDEDGVLRGFGLTQHTPALRNQLLAELGKAA